MSYFLRFTVGRGWQDFLPLPSRWSQELNSVSRLASQAPLTDEPSHCLPRGHMIWEGLRMWFHQDLLFIPFFLFVKRKHHNSNQSIKWWLLLHFYTSHVLYLSCNLEASSSKSLWLCCICFLMLNVFWLTHWLLCSDPWAICKMGYWDTWCWVVGEPLLLGEWSCVMCHV